MQGLWMLSMQSTTELPPQPFFTYLYKVHDSIDGDHNLLSQPPINGSLVSFQFSAEINCYHWLSLHTSFLACDHGWIWGCFASVISPRQVGLVTISFRYTVYLFICSLMAQETEALFEFVEPLHHLRLLQLLWELSWLFCPIWTTMWPLILPTACLQGCH
jgi:hypothetical protein